jgi:hypothetical protein
VFHCICGTFLILSINFPLAVVYSISMISLMGPMEWLFSSRCVANFDLLLLYLKSRRCCWKRTWKGRPVWPTYFMPQSGHVSR